MGVAPRLGQLPERDPAVGGRHGRNGDREGPSRHAESFASRAPSRPPPASPRSTTSGRPRLRDDQLAGLLDRPYRVFSGSRLGCSSASPRREGRSRTPSAIERLAVELLLSRRPRVRLSTQDRASHLLYDELLVERRPAMTTVELGRVGEELRLRDLLMGSFEELGEESVTPHPLRDNIAAGDERRRMRALAPRDPGDASRRRAGLSRSPGSHSRSGKRGR